MSNYNWCHGPECHTKSTQSRVRGSGTNKVLRTIKIKVRDYSDRHWFQGWENYFCNVSCFFDYMKAHWQEIVKIAPCTKAQETPIKIETKKYADDAFGGYYKGKTYKTITPIDNA